MTTAAAWDESNRRAVEAALGWIKLRLAAPGDVDAEAIAKARQALDAALSADPPPAAAVLAQRAGLSRFELDVLLLGVAAELDPRVAARCAELQESPDRGHPSFALALSIFDAPAWDALAPHRPLRALRLVDVHPAGSQPRILAPLKVDERVVHFFLGIHHVDPRLLPYLTIVGEGEPAASLPPSQRAAVASLTDRLLRAAGALSEETPLLQLVGVDRGCNRLVAASAARAAGLAIHGVLAELLPSGAAELEDFASLWEREALLAPVALLVDARSGEPSPAAIARVVSRLRGVVLVDAREPLPEAGRPAVILDVARPTAEEQRGAWKALAALSDDRAGVLSSQFDLGTSAIRSLAAAAPVAPEKALSRWGRERPQTPAPGGALNGAAAKAEEDRFEALFRACVRQTRPRLDALATPVDARAGWDDLVLPEADMDLLRRIVDQVRLRGRVYDDGGFRRRMNRGLGVTALFAGESGTGKTMAAEVVAGALGLGLYRIDLSSVVSKYIGETEKNLRRLFDAADEGAAVLLFDEADALFGKRSEVKDSHDRYANIEVNYLLQRMEGYRGVAILATNLKSALDTAFLRRIRFIVNFPFPGPAERAALWRKAFPPETRTEGLDCQRLAHPSLTGGHIHNIALGAAFLAARAGGPVTMETVLSAMKSELRKLDRPAHEADLRGREGGVS
jgi:ATPase family associated with various cellular activities (AAA)